VALLLSLCGFCGITAVIGIIAGFVARHEAKKSGAKTGMATVAIVIGFIWVAVFLVALIRSDTTSSPSQQSLQPTLANSSTAAPLDNTLSAGNAVEICKKALADGSGAYNTREAWDKGQATDQEYADALQDFIYSWSGDVGDLDNPHNALQAQIANDMNAAMSDANALRVKLVDDPMNAGASNDLFYADLSAFVADCKSAGYQS